ncbi:hypothetical protein VE03_05153 [Pseudogymnoascus sp. 23342-1-I1]|nr:hypothetical protein VE03_05153 [Pseudogymnoascus sp. 23342-1-I1]
MSEKTAPATETVVSVPAVTEKKRPEKPDEAAFEAAKEKAKKEHKVAQDKFNAAKAKLELAQPKNKDGTPSATQKRRQELQTKLNEIRKEQAGGKAGRNQVFDQIKKLDEQLKSRIAEQKTARSRVAFKNVDEVDRQIDHLDKQVNGGMMKLVDEKKALAEISALRKQRKNFAGFEDSQKGIDDVKSKIKALRDSLDDPVAKARSDEYNKIQAELDVIKAEQDEVFKNIHALRSQREDLYKESQAKYQAVRALEDNHWKAKKAFQSHEYEQRQKTRERIKAEQEQFNLQKKRERAEKVLAEASEPAYLDEIRRAQSLIHYLDPSTANEASKPLLAPSGLTASAQRTIDDSGIKGMKVAKKEDEEYFAGTGGKKGKKGRKAAASPAAPAPGKFTLPPAVLEDCSSMGIEPPMSAADIPAVLAKAQEKLAFWRADQKAQTEKNVAKAQKDIEKLDAEESTPATNGKKSEESVVASAVETAKDVVADVAEKVKAVTVGEDKE